MKIFKLILIILMVGLGSDAHATEQLSIDQVREYLARPHHHLLMRHAYAPGTGDPENYTLGDCFTQRNLNSGGRAQAAEIGQKLRDGGVEIDRVYSSQWCRCTETARLMKVGQVEELPAINSSWLQAQEYAQGQTDKLKDFLESLPAEETALFVTHQANILDVTGVGLASGQMIVIEYREDTLNVLGQF